MRKKINAENRGKVSVELNNGQRIKSTLFIDCIGEFIMIKGTRNPVKKMYDGIYKLK